MPTFIPFGTPDVNAHEISRRRFLETTAVIVAGFPLADSLVDDTATSPLIATAKDFKNLDAWLAVGTDGRVTAYTGNVELGTDVAVEE